MKHYTKWHRAQITVMKYLRIKHTLKGLFGLLKTEA